MAETERPSPIDIAAAKHGLAFGDNVLVKTGPATEALGLAGSRGQVYGHTTPSASGAEVVGECDEDFAVGVFIEQRNTTIWFSPLLLEFVDHGPGTEIAVAGKRWVRAETGAWEEIAAGSTNGFMARARRWLGLNK